MRFPTDVKLLWECTEKAYTMMCDISSQLAGCGTTGLKKKEQAAGR